MKHDILAIDIGGSKYMTGLLNEEGGIYAANRCACTPGSGEKVMAGIIAAARLLLEKNPDYRPDCIGVTIPGLADPKMGYWVEASFSGINNIPVAAILSKEFDIPVYIDNDAQACALAERLFGACRGVGDFLYLTVSNGIGGAIFAKDSLYYGAFGNAGELGHITVVENGRPCKCGKSGCLEMYAAGPGIVRNYMELGGCGTTEKREVDAKYIAGLAAKEDPLAVETFKLEGYYLGKAIAGACNLINPRYVIIGGGVSLAFAVYEKYLLENIRRFIYRSANKELKIMPSAFGYNGGLLGAAAVAVCGRCKKFGWGTF